MTVFLPVICAAGGQQEVHLALRSPVKDVVNKKVPNRRQHMEGDFFICPFCCFVLTSIFKRREAPKSGKHAKEGSC